MSRDKFKRSRKPPAREITPDATDERNGGIGGASREGFDIRDDHRDVPSDHNRDVLLGRNQDVPLGRNRDTPVSVHDTIARHNQKQAQKFTEHAAKPIETQSALPRADIPTPAEPNKYETVYRTAFEDNPAARSKPNTAYRRRSNEQRQNKPVETQSPDTADSTLPETIPKSAAKPDRVGEDGERLRHDAPLRQRLEDRQPDKLQDDRPRLSETLSQNARAPERSGGAGGAAQKKRGASDYRRFNEQPRDVQETAQPKEPEAAPRYAERPDPAAAGETVERLKHDSSYRQRFEEQRPERLETPDSLLRETPSQNARSSGQPAGDGRTGKGKRGAAYQRLKFEEFRSDASRTEPFNDSAQQPYEPAKDAERHTEQRQTPEVREPLTEGRPPARDTPFSPEQTPRAAPERLRRLLHDPPQSAPKEIPRRKTAAPAAPDAVKFTPPGESKPESAVKPAEAATARKGSDETPAVTENIKPMRDVPMSHERTPRAAQNRPERLQHDRKDAAADETPRRRPESPDAMKYAGDKKPDNGNAPAVKTDKAAHGSAADEPDKPTADDVSAKKRPKPERVSERGQTDKPGKLRFSEDESSPAKDGAPVKKPDGQPQIGRKFQKAQSRADRSAAKLEKAKDKLPKKRRVKVGRTFDEAKNKPKRKLVFEKEVKTQHAHLKGPLITRPVKAAAHNAGRLAHSKMFEAERENVAVKAAHRGEMLAEGGLRAAYRMHKTAPYRRVERLTAKTTKLNIKASYQKALNDNPGRMGEQFAKRTTSPKLKSNIFSRMAQKRKIKREYAKAAREAKKAGKAVKKTGDVIAKIGRAIVRTVARHPLVFGIIGALFLLVVIISSLVTSCSNMGSGFSGVIAAASYLARDADVDGAELAYTEWEADLQLKIGRTESDYPGYDEYRYNIGDISHNPYELAAFLTAAYQEFTFTGVEAALRQLFAEQYMLTFTPSTETRYADPYDSNGDGDYEPYNWRVMTVTLTSRPFTELIYPRMNADQRRHYELLMRTKGARQYSGSPLDFNWLPYVTSYYGYRVHPISGVKNYHMGVDIAVPVGTDVRAGHDGTVSVGYDAGGYGHYVTLTGADGLVTKYAHLDSVLVSGGQSVKAGDVIAKSGNSGNSTGPHLHFEVIKDGQYLNPLYFAITNDSGSFPVYGDPGAPMGDGSYAALIAEAERYIGYRYVWGGSSPSTSFDCSGYVSYILRASGVKDVGRQTAQGLYNICTPIPPSEAQPGDLIFFTGTYSSANPVTHVGLYVGGSPPRMLHAGDPIGYAYINTSYWQSHLYSFGRLPE